MFVSGIPKPAGSKRALFKNNKIVVFDMSKNKDWRRDIQILAKEEMNRFGKEEFFYSPLYMKLEFFMPIPKSLIKKKKAGDFHINKPDLTKLIRCVEDALSGIVYQDDRFIVKQECYKYYGENPGVRIHIEKI